MSIGDTPSSPTGIIGFPTRALRDPDLSIEDLRVLVHLGLCAAGSGWCAEDIGRVARQTGLSETIAAERLDGLLSRGYVVRRRRHRQTAYALATGTAGAEDGVTGIDEGSAPHDPAPTSERRKSGRSVQAKLHGDLLRRGAGRTKKSFEFDEPVSTHPIVAALMEAGRTAGTDLTGTVGFRFWLRTILPPEDVVVFSDWASRRSADYRRLIRKFNRASDDQAIESLLEDTLELVDREKDPARQRGDRC